MNWSEWKTYLSQENILHFLEQYRDLGFLPGVLLPLLESIIPVLPLFIIVAGNAAAYGFWLGALFSWLGAVIGSMIVFFLVRKLGQQRFLHFITKHHKIEKLLGWMERRGFGTLFLIYCFPFTPSALINVIAGLSRINQKTFVLSVALGKLVMIAIISFIGYDFLDVIKNPLKLGLAVFGILVLWLGGKVVESRMKQSHQA
ncbi:TVP38/TMEM64 family protein [Fictibacillus sp. KIGAM418]|uniref:TVP38/TMEM64 family membrane protein n=1 Tax=Fictibacillus marinisediminis TaxID=2878389 RepID=A0A9X1XB98_9BACL|nr:TVP38/TMEM64 family protein [Fictibacillus marinisediminis]MCK6256655.1 TVP38/TMEM64 family protein [Fictibacillus marinisediminis]